MVLTVELKKFKIYNCNFDIIIFEFGYEHIYFTLFFGFNKQKLEDNFP